MDSKTTTSGFTTMKTEQSLHLPEEVMEEIMSRLPVKSLLKFRCVSKSWRSLIGSERFIKSHLQNSRKNTAFPHQRVILKFNDELEQYCLHSLFNDMSPLDVPTNILPSENRVMGCCNGVVCILEQNKYFSLWNPATRVVKKLPEIDQVNGIWISGFGWEESSDEYNVFARVCVSNPSGRRDSVYSSKTNLWKIVESYNDLIINYVPGRFVCGKFHWHNKEWAGSREHYIISFDVKTEMFGVIELPSDVSVVDCFHLTLGVLGGCLCAVHCQDSKKGVDVWVLKEYGVKESWQKLVNLARLLELMQQPFSASFVVGPNGEILLFSASTFVVYYPKDNEFRRSRGISFSVEASLCIESLVSP